ncbi:MAG: hypothetical protein LIP23_06635 [Planctomycetes bacterium]|nr:hypothetical protein [Planctomycetota bacterium]
MKKAMAILCAALLASLSCFGGEREEYTYLDGVYSFSVPSGWAVVGDEESYTGITISPRHNMESHVLIHSPNPHVGADELDGFVGAYLAAKFAALGAGEVDEVEQEDGVVTASYTTRLKGKEAVGCAFAFMSGSYAILIDAQAPDDDSVFLDNFESVIDSLEVDSRTVQRYEEELDAIGVKMLEEIAELAGL